MRYLLSALVLFPILLSAQDSVRLDEVIITDNRIETSVMESGRNVQVISKRQIEQLPVQSVNELLQHVAGVDFRQRGPWGAQADVSLRGGSFDQCLILVNGIKVNDPQTGHHAMNLGIDLSSVRQIEVLKGPAASRYGLNSFSGVINIITEPDAENAVEIQSAYGQAENSSLPNNYLGGYNVNAGAHFGVAASRHMISVGQKQSTGYRPNTDLNQQSVNYQGITKTKAGDFNIMGSFVQNDFGASGFYAFPIDATSDEEVTTYLVAAQHTIRKGAFQMKSKIYTRKNFDTYTLFRDAPTIYQNRHRTDVGGGEVHGAYTYSIGTAAIGVEYRQEAINSSNLGKWTRDNIGVFAENRINLLNERLLLGTGIYVNQSSDFGMQYLPSVDANVKVTKDIHAFMTWGQSFRVPTFTDLYYVGPTNVGNAGLLPERSNNYEGGLKWTRNGQNAQASVFYNQATDLIDWTRDSLNHPWQPQNYSQVNTLGADFNYSIIRERKINSWLTWSNGRLGYTWLQMDIASQGDVISRYALNNLRHQITAQGALTIADKYGISLTGRYLDRQAYNSYWLVDAMVQYKVDQFRLWADCTNLLDTKYIETANAPMPGRWYRLGVDVRIK
ncbi:MAG: TonB-dependent receptor [Flavobacteriales bacterium]